jgi:glycyl-tRNA synthetase beta chain
MNMPTAKELLLEIGTEEIPSGLLSEAIGNLASLARQSLEENRLSFGEIRTLGTPRRLVLLVQDLEEAQQPLSRQIVGPSARAAFDGEGKPTPSALGFARAQGIPWESLTVKTLERGDYVVATFEEAALSTAEILPSLLPKIIASLPLPKSMRWGEGNLRFLRPIRWLLAFYGSQVIPFEMDGVASTDQTHGHRFLSPQPVRVRSFSDYETKLKEKFVIVDPVARQQMIQEAAAAEAARFGGIPEPDQELLWTVANLVEYPVAICGHFDEDYLQLPREVITTPMKKHQRYFPVVNGKGELLPYFVTISNMKAQDVSLIRAGNERVLSARLADAQFFYREDRKTSLEERVPQLQHIVYQEQLGSLYDRTLRIVRLSGYLAEAICPDRKELATKAALLAKADLLSSMVKEFPNLQGVMGRIYATQEGKETEVATAIEEHYLPRFAGDRLPQTLLGAIVSIADKLDSVAGYFSLGLIPTGSEDPYALRRQGSGIILVVLDRGMRFSLSALLQEALAALAEPLGKQSLSANQVKEKVVAFLGQRLQGILSDQGFAPDLIEAILAAGFDDLVAARRRAEALSALRQQPDFENLAIAFKRVLNILPPGFSDSVDPQLFQQEAERQLGRETQMLQERILSLLAKEDFLAALEEISRLRPAVDRFFNEVMVMAKEEEVKRNRLALLFQVSHLLSGLADLSKLSTG